MKNDRSNLEVLLKQKFDSQPVPDSVSPENIRRHITGTRQTRRGSSRIFVKVAAVAAAAAIAVTTGLGLSGRLSGEYRAVHSALREQYGGSQLLGSLRRSLFGTAELLTDEDMAAQPNGSGVPEIASHSETNVQIHGVDEADVVKTDGTYLYVVRDSAVYLLELKTGATLSSIDLSEDYTLHDIYLYDEGLLAAASPKLTESDEDNCPRTALLYLSAAGGKLALSSASLQSGSFMSSRMTGGVVYLVTQYSVYSVPLFSADIDGYIPYVSNSGGDGYIAEQDIAISENCPGSSFTVVSSYSAADGSTISSVSLLSSSAGLYCTADALYLYSSYWLADRTYTEITPISLSGGKLSIGEPASVAGWINNQFSFTSRGEYLIVCTTYSAPIGELDLTDQQKEEFDGFYSLEANAVYALDSSLTVVSSLKGLGVNETIRSVRSVGDYLYFVTFMQTDPLFAVDISDPQNLRLEGELKLPGYSSYLHPFGSELLVGLGYSGEEDGTLTGVKLSLFDVSDPRALRELSSASVASIDAVCEALDNHKAFFADAGLGIVGIPLAEYADQGLETCYKLFSVSAGGITELCTVRGDLISGTGLWEGNLGLSAAQLIRGVRSGDIFYVVFPTELVAVSLSDLSELYRADY